MFDPGGKGQSTALSKKNRNLHFGLEHGANGWRKERGTPGLFLLSSHQSGHCKRRGDLVILEVRLWGKGELDDVMLQRPRGSILSDMTRRVYQENPCS